MHTQILLLIGVAGLMFLIIGGLAFISHYYTLNGIKSKTVGDGQHGTARWATKQEIRQTYAHIPFEPELWRQGKNLPDQQGLILGCEGPKGHVTAVVFKRCLRTIDPETKKFSPVYDEQETMTLEADHVVFAIGQAIDWGRLLEGTKVEFWRGNYPVADPLTYQTAEPDIFVGGDVYHGPKFAIDAIEDGKCAAESLHRYVHKGADLKTGRNRRDFIMLDKENISVECYDHAGRQEAGLDESVPKHSFRDAHKTLTAEQVKIETARCLGCGASWVDPNKCIGCGVCTTKCVFDAIHLKRDHPECSKMMKAEDKVKGILPMAFKRLGQTVVTKVKKD